MPPLTRSRKAPAVADKPLPKSNPSKTASTIPAKRGSDNTSTKEGETASLVLPKAKRVAFSDKTNLPTKIQAKSAKSASKSAKSNTAQNGDTTGKAPQWAWDIYGRWEVRADSPTDYSRLHRELNVSDEGKGPMYLTIRSSSTKGEKRQMWAEIEFGALEGVLRFCPVPKDQNASPNNVTEFEKACDLEGCWPENVREFEKACDFEGCWPGPNPIGQTDWLTRGRSLDVRNNHTHQADQFQTECTFKQDEDGRLKLASFFFLESGPLHFHGFKLDGEIPPFQDHRDLFDRWDYYEYSDDIRMRPYYSRDGPWDITGDWYVWSRDLAAFFGCPELYGKMGMKIQFTDDIKDNKAGKQLWAIFKFGSFQGIIRFCDWDGSSRRSFEEKCFLAEDVQVARKANGIPRWSTRWRATSVDTGAKEGPSDTDFGSFTFCRSYGRDLQVHGHFTREDRKTTLNFHACRDRHTHLSGIDYADVVIPQASGTSVHEMWARHGDVQLGEPRGHGSRVESQGSVASDSIPPEDRRLAGPASFVPNNIDVSQGSKPVQRLDSSMPRLEAHAQPIMKAPEGFWDVEGQYTLKSVSHRKVDTTSFRLKMYYYRHCSPCQLYGEFDFGDLKGIMRLCPLTAKEDSTNCTASEFNKFCDLDTGVKPGLRNSTWVMNWRGIDGGMRQNRKLGGTPAERKKTELYFVHDPTSSTLDFTAIDIEFCMIYSGEEFVFKASKKGNLEREFAKPPWLVKQRWDELEYNPFEDNMVSQPRTYTAFAPVATADGAIPTSKTTASPAASSATSSELIDIPPAGVWDVTGEWIIQAPHLADFLGLPKTTEMNWTIHMDNVKSKHHERQIWATFSFGDKFQGTARLCPRFPTPATLKKFEKCCMLKSGYWPSNIHNKWLMRWRGAVDSQPKKIYDDCQTEVEFGTTGKLTIGIVMLYGSIPFVLKGYKLRDVIRPEVEDSVDTCWKKYT
ncbi:hypothetical protein HYFRA_00004824 [Hymenoscyphus fraxineus]|uniref:Uncharacterized protein n=1 Tax=Hymenoscyphus fraxineus TaxID=746836 RepID=A0A9N9KLL5_9HELO|nr:hypothetical protein HYFRA_00004824 [Hymenoscyphus fraxineus]